MRPEKFWIESMQMYLTEDESEKWREDLAGLANLICSEIAKRSMTREEVATLFDCVKNHLTFGGFNPVGNNEKAPTP